MPSWSSSSPAKAHRPRTEPVQSRNSLPLTRPDNQLKPPTSRLTDQNPKASRAAKVEDIPAWNLEDQRTGLRVDRVSVIFRLHEMHDASRLKSGLHLRFLKEGEWEGRNHYAAGLQYALGLTNCSLQIRNMLKDIIADDSIKHAGFIVTVLDVAVGNGKDRPS